MDTQTRSFRVRFPLAFGYRKLVAIRGAIFSRMCELHLTATSIAHASQMDKRKSREMEIEHVR